MAEIIKPGSLKAQVLYELLLKEFYKEFRSIIQKKYPDQEIPIGISKVTGYSNVVKPKPSDTRQKLLNEFVLSNRINQRKDVRDYRSGLDRGENGYNF